MKISSAKLETQLRISVHPPLGPPSLSIPWLGMRICAKKLCQNPCKESVQRIREKIRAKYPCKKSLQEIRPKNPCKKSAQKSVPKIRAKQIRAKGFPLAALQIEKPKPLYNKICSCCSSASWLPYDLVHLRCKPNIVSVVVLGRTGRCVR